MQSDLTAIVLKFRYHAAFQHKSRRTLPYEHSSFEITYPVFAKSLNPKVQTVMDFITLRFPNHGQDELENWIVAGRIKLNNRFTTISHTLSPDDQISVCFPNHVEEITNCDWKVVWENDEIMAVHKPHNLPVSRTTRNLYNTLIQLIRRQTPYYDAHLLHRLDTETAGLMLIAKNKAADLKWKKQLNVLIERKIYRAEVDGIPKWHEKTVECYLSEKTNSVIRSQTYVVDTPDEEGNLKPKWSKTAFRVVSTNANTAVIECELFTGRKHQIRAHLSWLGHPIIGDKIYNHEGVYYLKRLDKPLSQRDLDALGSSHHKLMAVKLVIRPDPELDPIHISLD